MLLSMGVCHKKPRRLSASKAFAEEDYTDFQRGPVTFYERIVMETGNSKSPAAALYDELDRSLWITKHSRYNAAYRLKRKNSLSIYSIAILSVYALTITLLEKYGFQVNYGNLYGLVSIILSVFILVVSLSEAGKNYGVASERLFLCGNEIRDLLDSLKKYNNKSCEDYAGIDDISQKYSHILKTCAENHEKLDFDLHRAEYYEMFDSMNIFWSIVYKFKYHISTYWFYSCLIILPPVIFWQLM